MQIFVFSASFLSCPLLVASEEAISLDVRSNTPTTQAAYDPCSIKAFLTVMARSAPASPPRTGANK